MTDGERLHHLRQVQTRLKVNIDYRNADHLLGLHKVELDIQDILGRLQSRNAHLQMLLLEAWTKTGSMSVIFRGGRIKTASPLAGESPASTFYNVKGLARDLAHLVVYEP